MMKDYVALYIQQNLARRHEPTACLNRVLDELAPFSFLRRTKSYLDECVSTTAFPEILRYLYRFLGNGDLLPRVVPIACIQEPNLSHGYPTGFPGKLMLCTKDARAAIITLQNLNLTFMESVSHRDCAWAITSNGSNKMCIASFYSDINESSIQLEVRKVKAKCSRLVLMGDSNAHSSTWGSSDNNARGDNWEQYIIQHGLHIANDTTCTYDTFSNHLGHSNIDIALSSNPQSINDWTNTNTFHGSDHAIILMHGNSSLAVNDKYFQNLSKTDWQKFERSLPHLTEFEVKTTVDFNRRAGDLISNIQIAFNKACPQKKAYPGTPCKWWTPTLSNLLRKKKIQAGIARRHRGTQRGYRALIAKRSLGSLFQKTVRKEKAESWKLFTSNISSSKNIASLFKTLKHKNNFNLPLLTRQDGTMSLGQEDNLTILRQSHFSNSDANFTRDEGDNQIRENTLPDSLSDFLSIELLTKAIASLPNGKAPGPDGIKNEILSRLPAHYKQELLNQFRFSIANSYLPLSWLDINAIYIKKAGNRSASNPKTYRPIGLSSSLLKLCERLINWRLKSTVLSKGIPKQHAFTLGKSTETAISDLVNFMEKAKSNNQMAIVLSIDIQGAFDSVPFDVIRDSLEMHGVEPEIVRWLDYLSRNRVITTKEGNAVLSFRPLEGTTQGGLNGPDIWVICLWAIIFTAAAAKSKLSKFADDLISAIMGKDITVMRDILQMCLNELCAWLNERGLTISAQKSMCMIVNKGRKIKMPKNLELNGTEIPFVEEFKYLGVTVDSNLTWRPHVRERLKKAKSDLMIARKLVTNTWGLTPQRMAWLYQSIVRPSIDYSCHVWARPGDCPPGLMRELDKIQRLALTSITACMYTTPTRALERLTNIKPLWLHLKEKAANTIARIYHSVDKSNWDGIGIGNKRGHLFIWKKYLGINLRPIQSESVYNFSNITVDMSGRSPQMVGITIFTDGSKTREGTGSGWAVFNDNDLVLRGNVKLPDHSSVYEAEMIAIKAALTDLELAIKEGPYPVNISIYVDNQAALRTLNSLKLSGEIKIDLLRVIKTFEQNHGCRLNFLWVKGHSDVYGNELADYEAKMGCRSDKHIYLQPSLGYIKASIRTKINQEWHIIWNNLPTCRQSRELITFTPSSRNSGALFTKGRLGSRKLISLLTGHNNLKYHVFKRMVNTTNDLSPCCRYCKTDLETSWHLLYECPCFETKRREFIYSPENPKTGPDIDWYWGFASHLGIWNILLDREYLNAALDEDI